MADFANIMGMNIFMPVFSFLFVVLIIYTLLAKTKILGGSNFVNLLVSFIIGVVFMSISSLELYIRTIIPWFVVMIVIVFCVLLIAGFAKGDLKDILSSKFGMVMVGILGIVFLIAAIRVFNPIFHPDLVITSAESGSGIIQQIKEFFVSSKIAGSVLLMIIAALVAWVVTKK